MQDSFCSLGEVGEFLLNMRSGAGRLAAPSGFFMCDELSPWQLVQVGVRPSAATPCRVLAMANTRGPFFSVSSWQAVHLASPRSTLSALPNFREANISPAFAGRLPHRPTTSAIPGNQRDIARRVVAAAAHRLFVIIPVSFVDSRLASRLGSVLAFPAVLASGASIPRLHGMKHVVRTA